MIIFFDGYNDNIEYFTVLSCVTFGADAVIQTESMFPHISKSFNVIKKKGFSTADLEKRAVSSEVKANKS